MKCPNCGHAPLQGVASIPDRLFDLTARRGSIIITHVETTKLKDWKRVWDTNTDGTVRELRGPIICPKCYVEYVYRVGSVPALVTKGSYEAKLERLQRKEDRDEENLPDDDGDE